MKTKIIYTILIIIAVLSSVNADEVGAKNRKANKLYSKGQYDEALKLYDDALLLDPSNAKLKMNKGSTHYRLGEFDEAEKSYRDAVSSQLGKKAQADAHYNLGNIQYKQAEKLESSGNAESARKKYSGALESYINTLKLRPNDMDAKWNLQLAHQKIDLLKNQQDKNQDENKDQNRQQDNQDQQQKDKQQDDKKDQENKDQSDNKDQQDQNNEDQQDKDNQQQQQPDKKESDQRKEDAQRLIEQYADDMDTLNKPKFQRARIRQPEKDW